MNYITTTQLRTKSSQMIEALLAGHKIDLIHRSKVVGEIKPVSNNQKVFNSQKMMAIVSKLKFPPLSVKEMEKRYRQHLMKKYGQGLS